MNNSRALLASCAGYLIWMLSLMLAFSGYAQKTSVVVSSVPVDFTDKPSKVNIISPKELTAKSRGLKASNKKFLEIEGTVMDEQGIREFVLNGKPIEVSANGYFLTNTSLVQGQNELRFTVLDNNSNVTDTIFTITRTSSKNKVSTIGDYYALLIGVQNYEDSAFVDLDNPIGDTKLLYNLLTTKYGFDPTKVNSILDPDLDEFYSSFDDLSGKAGPEDNVLIFYAGHGVWDEEADVGYWLPSNAQKDKKSAWFRNSTLRDYIKEINSRHTLVIADACFSGAIFKSRSGLVGADMATHKLHELPSRKVMTSGALTPVPDNSVFLKFLIDRLSKNRETYLSAGQLYASFKIAVMNNSESIPQFGAIQNTGDEGGDFIFINSLD